MIPLQEFIQTCGSRVDASLCRWLPGPDSEPVRLHRAMRYAVLDGGKRVRPLLVYGAGLAAGGETVALDGPATAVELVHAYSLIHDDLPAMDDDDLRRGKPTCHRAFDEATALLAGDALQTLAFEVLATDPAMAVPDESRVRMVAQLARACGAAGMAGGQAMDLAAVGRSLTLEQLETMHRHKTGALIRASVTLGALGAGCRKPAQLSALDRYADAIGLAFQIQDDILDVSGNTATLGKMRGADQARNKPTYPSLLGLEEARRKAESLCLAASASLEPFGATAQPLRELARYVVDRVH